MDRCQLCSRLVDTDDDPEAYYLFDKQLDACMCEQCREEQCDCYGCVTQRKPCLQEGMQQ